jgi:hypothetical protein
VLVRESVATLVPQVLRFNFPKRESASYAMDGLFCGLTFELTGRQRQDARPGPVKMYRVPPARAWWRAVGSPVERRVRPRAAQTDRRLRWVLQPLAAKPKAGANSELTVNVAEAHVAACGDTNKLIARRSTLARSALNKLTDKTGRCRRGW